MQVSLTIIRYPKKFVPFAFFAMAIHRLPLWLNAKTSFYKLMGSGRNGTFDKKPDLQQWAILCVKDTPLNPADPVSRHLLAELYGSFIAKWFKLFSCETFTMLLEPIEGHGLWDGAAVFGPLPANSAYEGPVAILTRASIRLNKLKYFWQHVSPIAEKMIQAKGFILSFGIGEIPWIKQATFSVWENKEAMKTFAYQLKEHAEVIRKTREQNWYSENMFVRFKILGSNGCIKGINPLDGKL